MAVGGLYRRILPSPPAIEFASSEGKQLFSEALQCGTMEGFFKLISSFQTQSEPAYCGLASLSMVLNALSIDPGRKWKGPWRWFDESMLDCCEPLEKVKAEGITFGKVACLAHCSGAKVKAYRTNQSSLDDFRDYIIKCTSSEEWHLIASYHRKPFKQVFEDFYDQEAQGHLISPVKKVKMKGEKPLLPDGNNNVENNLTPLGKINYDGQNSHLLRV
ncbi:Glutathione gamma-glutamylcysteinyltransferase 1 [Platanthera zijinensis]|uniref:glutathione gamma-glutamylcysteinyltransferase n=1 Tax=Platanthera zijinensis TaxID=2320716 RepID=A0AAP0G4T4_9ASPA